METKSHSSSEESQDAVDRILATIGLTWFVVKASVGFSLANGPASTFIETEGHAVLYRSDTKESLAVVPASHSVWQPREIVEFYLSFASFYGFGMERIGYVQGGKSLCALLSTGESCVLDSARSASTYVLLSTGYESTLAARARAICLMQPGDIALRASPGKPEVVAIPRSPEFLTPADLAGVGELVRECASFPGFLEDLKGHSPTESQIHAATASVFGSPSNDPGKPSRAALEAVLAALHQIRGAATRRTSLDLLYALCHVSDARDRRRRSEDLLHLTWFGAGAERKHVAVRSLARMLKHV